MTIDHIRLQGIAVVRHEHGIPCRRFHEPEARHVPGRQEPALLGRNRGEVAPAIALQPEDASFRLALGNSFVRLDKRSEAAAAYQEYLRLSPSAPDADKVRARITELTGARDATSGTHGTSVP